MRHTAGRLNRVWLTIIGLILALGGGVTAAIGLGLFEGLTVAGLRAPDRDRPILEIPNDPATANTLATSLVVVGAVLGILSILWLLAQVPRKHGASTVKLQDPDNRGLTRLKPTVLEDAISDRVEELEDVTSARTVIRGSSRTPDITLRITTASNAAIPNVISDVEDRVMNDMRRTFGTEPASLGIELDVKATRKRDNSVTLDASRIQA